MEASGATTSGQSVSLFIPSGAFWVQTVSALTPFVGVADAVWPITAMVPDDLPSGRVWPEFLSRTEPFWATCSATASLYGVCVVAGTVVGIGWSNRPDAM